MAPKKDVAEPRSAVEIAEQEARYQRELAAARTLLNDLTARVNRLSASAAGAP